MTVSSAPPAARNAAYQQLVAQRNAFTLTLSLIHI